ncbi:MAG: glutathione S-transferase [Myxococcales bacterium]|nr:glutathione S-transferase [Myxococcales bacterium]
MPESPDAKLTLYYAPRTRSFTALWLLEELGEPYRLESFALHTGRHKQPDYLALNPMGKVPLVVDGDVAVAELGAMAIYLPDRYPQSKLAPAVDDPDRAAFLRWCFFSSAIMEPAYAQKFHDWSCNPSSVAWGSFEQMLAVLDAGVQPGPYLLGERFSAADVLVGSAARFGVMFGVLPKDGPAAAYAARLGDRDALARAEAIDKREGERFPPPAPQQQQ